MKDIVVAGHICLDVVPEMPAEAPIDPGGLLEIGPAKIALGGSVANTGGDLANLGTPVRLSAAVADDAFGLITRRELARRGLPLEGLRTIEATHTSYSVILQPGGADRTVWHHCGANAVFDGSHTDLTDAGLLHMGYLPLLPAIVADGGAPLTRLLSRAKQAGVTTSLDLAVVDPRSTVGTLDWRGILDRALPLTDVFSPSVDDLRSALRITREPSKRLVEELADDSIAKGAAVVLISAGPLGLYLRTASRPRLSTGGHVVSRLLSSWIDVALWQLPLPADIVTTNGAGDAASAGLLHALWKGLDPNTAVWTAAAAAATKISGQETLRENVHAVTATAWKAGLR